MSGNGTEEQIQQEEILVTELMGLIRDEWAFYKQKYRMNWLQEGDNNTHF